MSDSVIHNIKISYDESSPLVRDFVNYLKSDKRKDKMKSLCGEARRAKDFKINISDEKGNEFTLICEHEHMCSLRLRGM